MIITDLLLWFGWGLVRLFAAILAIPFAFVLPRNRDQKHLKRREVLALRLKTIGKSMATSFNNSPL